MSSFYVGKVDFPNLYDETGKIIREEVVRCLRIGYNLIFGPKGDIPNEILHNRLIMEQRELLLNAIKSGQDQIINYFESVGIQKNSEEMILLVKNLLGLSSTSNNSGKTIENFVQELFINRFKDYVYTDMAHISHKGDAHIDSPSGMKFLLEIKHYSYPVDKKQVDKFKNDMNSCNLFYGIFISTKSNIIGKKGIDYEIYHKNGNTFNCVYINNAFTDSGRIECAIHLLESLYKNHNEVSNSETLLNEISKRIHTNLGELNEIIDNFCSLKQGFINMQKNIHKILDEYYLVLRETEITTKQKITTIIENTMKEVNECDVAIEYKDSWDKVYEILDSKNKSKLIFSKLSDIFCSKGYNIIFNNDKIYNVSNDTNNYTLKLTKSKVYVIINNCTLEYEQESNDSGYETLKIFL